MHRKSPHSMGTCAKRPARVALPAKKIGDGGCPAAIRHTDMLTPVIILNSSPETCCKLPLPLDPMLILPGLALA